MGKRKQRASKRRRANEGSDSSWEESEPCHVTTPATIGSYGHDPTYTPRGVVITSKKSLLPCSRYPTRSGIKALASLLTAESEENGGQMDTDYEAFFAKFLKPIQVSKTPDATPRPVKEGLETTTARTKTPLSRVAKRGKLIENSNKPCLKSEEKPSLTAQSWSRPVDNQSQAQEEPVDSQNQAQEKPIDNQSQAQEEPIDSQSQIPEKPADNQSQAQEEPVSPVPPSPAPDEVAHKTDHTQAELAKSLSLGLTKMAAIVNNSDSDSEEINSNLNPSVVMVNGYTVKAVFASLLREIIAKYGDIAKSCTLQTALPRAALLELVCDIIQRLEEVSFKDITLVELKSLLSRIDDIEVVKIEVGWLRDRVLGIYDSKILFNGASSLKAARIKNEETIEKVKKEMEKIEKAMLVSKEKLVELIAEREKIHSTALDTKAKVKLFYGRSLVEGLI